MCYSIHFLIWERNEYSKTEVHVPISMADVANGDLSASKCLAVGPFSWVVVV